MKTPALALSVATLLALPGMAFADDDACYLHREMPIERQLRRLSIDLRGTVPDVNEYDAIAGLKELPDEVIAEVLPTEKAAAIEKLQETIARELGYKLVGHRLELYGVPMEKKPMEKKK